MSDFQIMGRKSGSRTIKKFGGTVLFTTKQFLQISGSLFFRIRKKGNVPQSFSGKRGQPPFHSGPTPVGFSALKPLLATKQESQLKPEQSAYYGVFTARSSALPTDP